MRGGRTCQRWRGWGHIHTHTSGSQVRHLPLNHTEFFFIPSLYRLIKRVLNILFACELKTQESLDAGSFLPNTFLFKLMFSQQEAQPWMCLRALALSKANRPVGGRFGQWASPDSPAPCPFSSCGPRILKPARGKVETRGSGSHSSSFLPGMVPGQSWREGHRHRCPPAVRVSSVLWVACEHLLTHSSDWLIMIFHGGPAPDRRPPSTGKSHGGGCSREHGHVCPLSGFNSFWRGKDSE